MFIFYENKSTDFTYNKNGKSLEFPPHLHRHMELVYMLEGKSGTVVDGSRDLLCAGDVLTVFPNQVHQYYKTEDPENYLIFIFSPDILTDFKDILKSYLPSTAVVKNASANPRLLPLLNAVVDAYEKNSAYSNVLIKGYLLAFFAELFPMMTLLPSNSADMSIFKNVLSYCSANYMKELSLDILSRELHISKYHISRLFKKKLKMGFNEYINSIRISDAFRHLSEGAYNITEIAELVGFNTTRTFNRAFLQQTGMTPREYRAKLTG